MRSLVPDGRKSTLGAVEGLVNRERTATFTLYWQVVEATHTSDIGHSGIPPYAWLSLDLR